MSYADRVASVLIVEDETVIAEDLQERLIELGYDAYAIASSGDQALRIAGQRRPDLALMDIRLRGHKDGIETAALMRARFDVPVIYLTAHADAGTLARARDTAPHGFLSKPVRSTDLRSAIEISLHQHELEQQLRQRERWFATTLRSISEAVIASDLAGTVTFMNPAAEALCGVAATEAVGRPARDVVWLLDPAQPASPIDVALAHRSPVTFTDAPLRHPSGRHVIVADGAAPVVDGGQLLGAVVVLRDVTLQRSMQKQVELHERLAALGTMAAGVAHEVNNPLAVVLANAAFVRAELQAVAARADADRRATAAMLEAQRELESAAARIQRIVGDLRAFSRPATRTAGSAEVGDAVRWALQATAAELRYRARIVTDVDCPPVQLDETRLGQVLVNLLLNAAHAIAPGAVDRNTVTISGRRDGDAVVIEVRDTGGGMGRELADVVAGTGLGLAICHAVVTAAGGTLDVDSEVGAGSTFRVRLPVAIVPPPPAPVAAATAPRRGRILVIDDEPLMLKAMRRILRDHDVVCLTDAREALALFDRGEQFDLVFSDMMMPSMTGMELYERVRAAHPQAAARIVFVTAGVIDARIADFLAVVPNVWLEKPVAIDELRALVQHRLAAG